MIDTLTRAERSAIMARVRAKNTRPEMAVRRLAHAMGYRYRLHGAKLPGKPDMVFASRRKVILVHGCFWHRHEGCPKTRTPKSNQNFWQKKFEGNKKRDKKALAELRALGWDALVVWECETADATRLASRLREFLDG